MKRISAYRNIFHIENHDLPHSLLNKVSTGIGVVPKQLKNELVSFAAATG
jgi:hypothetical protein